VHESRWVAALIDYDGVVEVVAELGADDLWTGDSRSR
jgi:hypothetical protein